MRISLFLSGILLIIVLCTGCSEKITAEDLIANSIQAHGGIASWEAIKEIKYTKRTVLYDSLGTIESDETKTHFYTFYPEFYALLSWGKDSIAYNVAYRQGNTAVFENNREITDSTIISKFEKEIIGAYYVYWMPYRLLDNNAELNYKGLQPWPGEDNVHELQVSYPDSWNIWWYYFDKETYQLVGTKVYHEPTSSFIKNTEYETKTGLFLNAKRTSYRVDDLDTILFKRADYYYNVLNIIEK